MANVAKDFAQLISQSKNNKTGPYDTQATVKRVEGNTVWVSIPGGVDETPIDKTVNCTAGDKVQVRVSGGRAWITGNASAPPTDDKTANEAKTKAVVAEATAIDAKETADAVEGIAQAAQHSADTAASAAASAVTAANSAQSSADNASEYAARALGNLSTVQSVAETLTWITAHGTMTLTSDVTPDPTHVYFVVDAAGDYTVGGTTYAIITEPVTADMSTYYELSIDESLNNYVGTHLALDSEGLWLLPASSGTNKVLIATGAGSTYTVAGTYLVDSGGSTVASFRQDGATMSSGGTQIAHLGYGPGNNSGGGTSDAPYYTLGTRKIATSNYDSSATYNYGDHVFYNGIEYVCLRENVTGTWNPNVWIAPSNGNYSIANGIDSTATGWGSFSEGIETVALFEGAHAEGYNTISANGYAHSEGYGSIAAGQASHAENNAKALNDYSHAEGIGNAVGTHSHAENGGNAVGNYSHAEGEYTLAYGLRSHAQNYFTEALSNDQTTLGKYNIPDNTGTYAVIVGNGTAENARSNALTVDWSGNVEASGDIEDSSGNVLSDKIAKGDFEISSHTTSNQTISGGSTMSAATQTFTKTGYYPLAISGWVLNGSNATNLTLVHLYISSQASGSVGVTYRIHNAGSSQSTSSNVRVYILWIKEN